MYFIPISGSFCSMIGYDPGLSLDSDNYNIYITNFIDRKKNFTFPLHRIVIKLNQLHLIRSMKKM